jgi:alcohol dehydrogenase class IV
VSTQPSRRGTATRSGLCRRHRRRVDNRPLGKAIALESGFPNVAIPTTYAGSEVTPIHGLTDGGVKRTGKDSRVLPRTVIYDPELTLSLPLPLTVTRDMNAIAHAAEGLYAKDSNPINVRPREEFPPTDSPDEPFFWATAASRTPRAE